MAAPFQQWLTPGALAALRAAEGTSVDTQPPDDTDVTAAICALETALAGRPPGTSLDLHLGRALCGASHLDDQAAAMGARGPRRRRAPFPRPCSPLSRWTSLATLPAPRPRRSSRACAAPPRTWPPRLPDTPTPPVPPERWLGSNGSHAGAIPPARRLHERVGRFYRKREHTNHPSKGPLGLRTMLQTPLHTPHLISRAPHTPPPDRRHGRQRCLRCLHHAVTVNSVRQRRQRHLRQGLSHAALPTTPQNEYCGPCSQRARSNQNHARVVSYSRNRTLKVLREIWQHAWIWQQGGLLQNTISTKPWRQIDNGLISQIKVERTKIDLRGRFPGDSADIFSSPAVPSGTLREKPISGHRFLCLGDRPD